MKFWIQKKLAGSSLIDAASGGAVASFSDDEGGKLVFALFVEAAARAGHEVINGDGQNLAGDVGQLAP